MKNADAQKKVQHLLDVREEERETELKELQEQQEKKEEPVLKVDYVKECEKSLSKHLGRGVKIINGKRKGKFELEFYGQEDLQVLLDALMTLQKGGSAGK